MSHPIEDRLCDAYQAKTTQLTEDRLDQLTAAREQGLDGLFAGESEPTAELPVLDFDSAAARRTRRHHWIAPALAAAAVAALAIGVTAVSGMHAKPRPNPPASHISTPPPPTSAPAPSASASQTHTQTIVGPPYLPAGQTGSRSQVPWSLVGAGWRLLQREHLGSGMPDYDSSLYLYDPAGGRYLITDAVPANANLAGWSPDGTRAMFLSNDQPNAKSRFYQLQLASGSPKLILRTKPANFLGYTQPRGLAFLIEQLDQPNAWRLNRYSADGGLEFSYPAVIGGQQVSTGEAIYSADGSELILTTPAGDPFLVGNDGHFIRTFAAPAGYVRCTPVKLWQAGSMLERCMRVGASQSHSALIVQPLTGAAPRVLADAPARNTDGYWGAGQLSNGDLLLDNWGDCDGSTYDILHAGTGAIRPLRWPAGIPRPSTIIGMSGDIATFDHRSPSGCGHGGSQDTLYSYNMVTGQTRTLVDGSAIVLDWPGGPS